MNRISTTIAYRSLTALSLGLAVGLAACDEITSVSNTNFTALESFSESVMQVSQTRFRVEGINGNVSVTGSAQANSFLIDGEKRVDSGSQEDAEAYLDKIEVRITESGDMLLVQTIMPQETGGRNLSVNYQITVPEGVQVEVDNINGNVDVKSARNGVGAGTVNGNVTLEDVEGSVGVSSVNGNVTAEVTLPTDGTIAMATTNGNVNLDIPTNTSAELSAILANGNISTSNLTIQNQKVTGTTLTGTLGNGDGEITLATTNGNITIRGF